MNPSNLTNPPTVGNVFEYIYRNPIEILFRSWNWKSAVLSGFLRSLIYFFTQITFGWRAAFSAMSVEFMFRTFNTGIVASIGQAFRKARPKWLATLCVMLMLPAYGHVIEFALHKLNGDRNLQRSIAFSVVFSVLSAVFNLFAMRRGVLLVNDAEQKSFLSDLKKMPVITAEFVGYPFIWIYRKIR